MSRSPLILIPTPIFATRYAIGQDYIHSLVRSGGAPVMAPVSMDERDLRHLFEQADGVLLAGGPDCDPALFGEPAHEKTSGIDPDRDRSELALTRWAVAEDKPLFGICRGVQVMNVALGGTLIQDIPSQVTTRLEHQGADKVARDHVLHHVCVEPGSRLAGILGPGDVGVNSFHHQALNRLGDGLAVTSRSPDGVIESVERADRRFALGVQWHPENLAVSARDEMLALFQAFVAEAGRSGGRP